MPTLATQTRRRRPFDLADLARFERLFESATAVVGMRQVAEGARERRIIGLRHDVDRDLEAALSFALWEHERGYRATYFLLHTADYWHGPDYSEGFTDPPDELREAVRVLVELGHEVGFHNNCLAASLVSGVPADEILEHELAALRSLGAEVVGDAAHGDPLCWDRPQDRATRRLLFANYEMFVECAKPGNGEPDRTIERDGLSLTLAPRPLADFALVYESFFLPRSVLAHDSNGEPKVSWIDGRVERGWHSLALPPTGQMHVLLHPEWWRL